MASEFDIVGNKIVDAGQHALNRIQLVRKPRESRLSPPTSCTRGSGWCSHDGQWLGRTAANCASGERGDASRHPSAAADADACARPRQQPSGRAWVPCAEFASSLASTVASDCCWCYPCKWTRSRNWSFRWLKSVVSSRDHNTELSRLFPLRLRARVPPLFRTAIHLQLRLQSMAL